jgi:hypothetical protein
MQFLNQADAESKDPTFYQTIMEDVNQEITAALTALAPIFVDNSTDKASVTIRNAKESYLPGEMIQVAVKPNDSLDMQQIHLLLTFGANKVRLLPVTGESTQVCVPGFFGKYTVKAICILKILRYI